MIVGIDHIVIAVCDLPAGAAAYEVLLNRKADVTQRRDGVARAVITSPNVAVELMAPEGAGAGADRLAAALADGEGLKSLVFAAAEIERVHRHCGRVGLAPEPIVAGDGRRSFRANTERTHGVRIFFIERTAPPTDASKGGLDHVVIRSSDPERAAALYGARLGLDMRLDREVLGRRLLFFRCGDSIVEIVHDRQAPADSDRLWGLSWRVGDADVERTRLADAGFDVSEVRAGMKPGTRVFTLRSGTCGVPTLMIEPSKRD